MKIKFIEVHGASCCCDYDYSRYIDDRIEMISDREGDITVYFTVELANGIEHQIGFCLQKWLEAFIKNEKD